MNKKTLGVVGLLVLLAGGYLVYSKFIAKDKAPKQAESESGETGDSDTKLAADTKSSSSDRVAPPMARSQIQMDDDPEGALRLEGQVLDDAGVGVPKATVTLSSNPPRTTTTEADGTFVFDKLIGRTYALSARAGNLIGGPLAYKLLGEGGDPAVIHMRAGGAVTVTVTDKKTGKPIGGAAVELRTIEVRTGTTDSKGLATFEGVGSGWFSAVAKATGYGDGRQGLMMPSTAGADLKVELALGPGVTITGNVTGDGGAPLEGARVVAQPVGDLFGRVSARYDGVQTDSKGAFKLTGVPLGKLNVLARHVDYAPGKSELLDVVDDLEGVSVALERGGLITGRVVTTQKQPVPWASISLAPDGDASMSWGGGGRGTTADDKGEFELKGLPRTKLTMLAKSEAASSDVVSVDLSSKDEAKGVEIVLSVTGSISGKVVDGDGNDLPEVQVVLYPDWTSDVDQKRMALSQGDTTTTGGDGSFSFKGLDDGTFMLKPTRDTGNMMIWQAEGTRAKTGDTAVKLVLPKNGSIKGKVVSDKGEVIEAYTVSVGWPPGHPISDKEGKFALQGIPPGKYDLKIRGGNFADTTVRDVEVKAEDETDVGTIKVFKGRTVSGTVVDKNGSGVGGAVVLVAERLMGTADSLSMSKDESTDEMMQVRRATSDPDGFFKIRGLLSKELMVAAEHADVGRSRPSTLPKSGADSELTLKLVPTGSISGTVKRGTAVASGIGVVVTPSEGRMQMIVGQSDDKGAFEYSQLAEGSYEVSAFFGGGMSQQGVTRKVEVKGGDKVVVDLVFEVGEVTLTVTVTPEAGATVDATQLFLFPGEQSVSNSKELTDAYLGQESSGSGMEFSMKGALVLFKDQLPGKKTLCGFPITGDMTNPQFMQRLQENAANLKVVCKSVTVTESPKEQSVELTVPQMDPLPEPENQPAP